MAVAIPIIALGTLYVISNYNKNEEKEGFTNEENENENNIFQIIIQINILTKQVVRQI